MRGEEKVTEPAGQIADDLYQVIVEDGGSGEFDQPEKYGVPETYRVPFQAKMRIYREALVLFVLISKSKEDEKYKSVLRTSHPTRTPALVRGATRILSRRCTRASAGTASISIRLFPIPHTPS